MHLGAVLCRQFDLNQGQPTNELEFFDARSMSGHKMCLHNIIQTIMSQPPQKKACTAPIQSALICKFQILLQQLSVYHSLYNVFCLFIVNFFKRTSTNSSPPPPTCQLSPLSLSKKTCNQAAACLECLRDMLKAKKARKTLPFNKVSKFCSV